MSHPFAYRLVAALALLAACSQDPPGLDTGRPLPLSPALVSGPVIMGPGAAASGAAVIGFGAAYVSMPPGTDPVGVNVTVRNSRAGPTLTAPMTDGGFDPIAIGAAAGDTLLITVVRNGGAHAAAYAVVRARTRPAIVRTSPPDRKTDVVLNAVIQVIFSQPMDSASLTSALHLRLGAADVAGTVTVRVTPAGDILSASFSPTSPFAPLTAYQFAISTAAQGANGEALSTAVQVTFTTGPDAAGVAAVRVDPSLFQIVVGGRQQMSAVPVDAVGAPLAASCAWSTSDAAVADISSTGLLSALAPGTALIRATCGGVSGEATVTVVPVVSGLVFASVSVGNSHTCGVTTAGAAYCWGDNNGGALGDGTTTSSSTPVPVAGGLTFAAVSAGVLHTCGLTTAGALYCWGGGYPGGLRAGFTPVPVAPGRSFASVSVGDFHACGVTTRGTAYCWGENGGGELGDGTTNSSTTPVPVAGGLSFAAVSAGVYSTCGLTTEGAAYCWGNNAMGGLGTGTATGPEPCFPGTPFGCSTVPVAVTGGLTFRQLETKVAYAACGLTTGGTAYCWGSNLNDDLAFGTITGPEQCSWDESYVVPCVLLPTAVPGSPSLVSLSGSDTYTCGLIQTGEGYCWGHPQATRDLTSSTAPIAVPGGLRFAGLSAGSYSTCGVTPTGVAYCWGVNENGELGDGTTTYSSVPVKVAGQP